MYKMKNTTIIKFEMRNYDIFFNLEDCLLKYSNNGLVTIVQQNKQTTNKAILTMLFEISLEYHIYMFCSHGYHEEKGGVFKSADYHKQK